MVIRLSEWAGRPQVHIVGLFLSLMALIAVVAFAIGTLEYTKMRGKLMLTSFLVGGYFVTMLAATKIPSDGPRLRVRVAAQLLASTALFLLLLGLWGTPDSDGYWKATAIVTLLGIGMVFSGMVMRVGLASTRQRSLVGILTAVSMALTAMSAVAIAFEIAVASYWWIFGLLAAGWVAAAVALAATRLWERRTAGRIKPPQ